MKKKVAKKAVKKTVKRAAKKTAKKTEDKKTSVDDILGNTKIEPKPIDEVSIDDDQFNEWAPKDQDKYVVPQEGGEVLSIKASDAKDYGMTEEEMEYVDDEPEVVKEEPQEATQEPVEPIKVVVPKKPAKTVETPPKAKEAPIRKDVTVSNEILSMCYSSLAGNNKIIEWCIKKMPARLMRGNRKILTNRMEINSATMRTIRHLIQS